MYYLNFYNKLYGFKQNTLKKKQYYVLIIIVIQNTKTNHGISMNLLTRVLILIQSCMEIAFVNYMIITNLYTYIYFF
jgi:hypothetical protein